MSSEKEIMDYYFKHVNRSKYIYNTTDDEKLSPKIYDYSNLYYLSSICLFGIITSLMNITVLIKINKFNENIYLYMMINSVSDLCFLMTQISVAVTRCGSLCPYGYSYGSKFFEIYIYLYVGYIIVMFNALCETSVSIDRLLSFNSKNMNKLTRRAFSIRSLILFTFSAVVLAPIYPVARYVGHIGLLRKNLTDPSYSYDNFEILYKMKLRDEWDEGALKTLFTVLSLAKGFVLFVLISLANILVALKFRAHIEKKKKITTSKIFMVE